MSDNQNVLIGGLWQNQSKSGETYFTGRLGMARIVIFKNKKKQAGSTQPDWQMYVSDSREKPAKQEPTKAVQNEKTDLDDLPF